MAHQSRTVEQELARIATAAHGVVARAELLRAGVSIDEIRHRLGTGALIREYPGVYRVGHRAPSLEARYLAAVKACGKGALLAGRAAARLLRLIRTGAPMPEVIAPTQRRIEGVITHRCRDPDARDGMTWNAVPVTSVSRTLVDLARVLPFDELGKACHEAHVRHRMRPEQVEAVLARRPRSAGATNLKAIIRGESPIILSKLERAFLRLLRREGLPLPNTNRPVGGHYVDCRWPELKLTVELDSYTFHNTRHAWEQDHRREREAYARGDQFRRYTWGDVFEDPELMLTELKDALLQPARRAAKA